jgi:hypothetical protein
MSRVRHGPASENLHRRRHSEEDRRAEPGRCAKRRLNQRYFGRAILSLGLGAIAFAPIDLGGFQANHCIGVRRSVVRDASISGCMYLARRSPYPRRRTMKPMLGVTLGRWTTKRKLLATGLFCLSLATPGVASAASSGVPTVDIAITCRTSEKALIAIFGAETQQTFEICMQSENQARAEIVKNWQSYPAGGRQRCINTTGYMPSYVEWLTCLEMEQQVNELRKRAANTPAITEGRGARAVVRPGTPANSRGPRIGSEANPCPIVQFGSDGSITSVIAC